ncbi:MAG: nickel pincer cofactor biosynthesis protein LarC [Desulfobacteraceae bacterium]|nr:nickel pincer cofactor biosynthesis protein LarC [Desulfobacteraceae bacterium]MBC2749008.1 nickel pincer cofactor biosynthesis protein LarC [Desulfobacteraceae bacterium]
MTLGALIDLGVPVDKLEHNLSLLLTEPFSLQVTPVERHGIRALHCKVVAEDRSPSRHYADIQKLIGGSGLPEAVKKTALAIFHKIAVAEAGIHGEAVDAVHFHEVGALDSIVDIVGSVLGLAHLGVTRVMASSLPQGRGFVDCRHGRLPLPAPATLSLLQGIPVHGVDIEGELVTPTGAAIMATLGEHFGALPAMKIAAVGYGAGQRNYPGHPNLLRVMIGNPLTPGCEQDGYLVDTVHLIETTIDDMNPEIFGYLMEALFANGALDVCWIPVYMKKNRPGTLVQVLGHESHINALRDVIFKETTTIGLRVSTARRWMLPRETLSLSLSVGRVALKRIAMPDGEIRWVPEYESCRRVAREQDISIRRAYERIAGEAAAIEKPQPKPPTDH